jgi:hypothetical protein
MRKHIAAIISARSNTPSAASNPLKTLHTLFEHGIAINAITSNPATGVEEVQNYWRPLSHLERARGYAIRCEASGRYQSLFGGAADPSF